ncbi:MAG: hypothetical protein KJ069_17560 [Anaerolineae bacterium]|nr:hypothetical protein [Anaerolineae bacterium]
MNTLPRAVVAQILTDPQTYTSLRQHWRGLMNSERRHELTAVHHMLYLALTGKDWRKGFSLATNQRKLANGAYEGWEMFRALARLHSPFHEAFVLAPFEGVIIGDILQNLRLVLPKAGAHQYKATDFVDGSYPFAAYVPENVLVLETKEIDVT